MATALSIFQKLEASHPNNVYLLQKLAAVHLQMNDEMNAEFCLERIRFLEEANVTDMDVYGQILARADKVNALNQLADALLLHYASRPETWTTLALFQEVRGRHDKAVLFCDKAIAMAPNHAFAHRLRGGILMASQKPSHAAISFFRSIELYPDIACYEGLVDAYILIGKTKEAIASAKAAFFLAPRDPRAMTLVGLALLRGARTNGQRSSASAASTAAGIEKAKKSLHKALDVDPGLLRPLFALVDIYRDEGDYDKCLELLHRGMQGSMEAQNRFLGHGLILTRLGEIYAASQNYQKAMDCLNRALGLNPDLQSAQRSMERLEKILRDNSTTSRNLPNGDGSPDNDDEIIHDAPSNDSTQSSGQYHHHAASSRSAGDSSGQRSSYGYPPASSSYSLFPSSPS
jgi:tetratricopeptide (TPR) repeat protein